MDQSSPDSPFAITIIPPVVLPPVAAENGDKDPYTTMVIPDPGVPYCILCGRTSRFVDPFD
jgi:hypothetical protein